MEFWGARFRGKKAGKDACDCDEERKGGYIVLGEVNWLRLIRETFCF